MNSETPDINDLHYLKGQIDALQAQIIALAELVDARPFFLERAKARIEIARTKGLHSTSLGDSYRDGLDDAEAYLNMIE